MSAVPDQIGHRNVGHRYIECVNAASLDELVDLFAQDSVVIQRAGTFVGRDEIRRFYRDIVLPAQPQCEGQCFLEHSNKVVLELSVTTAGHQDAPADVVDLFDVGDDGRIVRLAIYFRR